MYKLYLYSVYIYILYRYTHMMHIYMYIVYIYINIMYTLCVHTYTYAYDVCIFSVFIYIYICTVNPHHCSVNEIHPFCIPPHVPDVHHQLQQTCPWTLAHRLRVSQS